MAPDSGPPADPIALSSHEPPAAPIGPVSAGKPEIRCVALARSTTVSGGVQIRYYMRVYQNRCRLSPVHLSGIVQGSATSAVSAGLAAEPAPGPPLRWPAPGCSFRAVCRGGSRRLSAGTTLVPDDGYRLLLGEPGAGGERLIEPGCAQPLADLGHQIGLHPPQMRPRRQADPPAQALGRAFQQRRPVRVAVCERQLGVPGQAQGHERGAAGRQAPVQRLLQQRPGLIEAAAHDI